MKKYTDILNDLLNNIINDKNIQKSIKSLLNTNILEANNTKNANKWWEGKNKNGLAQGLFLDEDIKFLIDTTYSNVDNYYECVNRIISTLNTKENEADILDLKDCIKVTRGYIHYPFKEGESVNISDDIKDPELQKHANHVYRYLCFFRTLVEINLLYQYIKAHLNCKNPKDLLKTKKTAMADTRKAQAALINAWNALVGIVHKIKHDHK